jgi:hypothetical protein
MAEAAGRRRAAARGRALIGLGAGDPQARPSGEGERSSTVSATSSERLSPTAKPSSRRARSRSPAFVAVSIRSISSSSGSRRSAVFLFGALPWTRAMPSMTVSTRRSLVAGRWPAWRWARAIAPARRRIVETSISSPSSAARCAGSSAGRPSSGRSSASIGSLSTVSIKFVSGIVARQFRGPSPSCQVAVRARIDSCISSRNPPFRSAVSRRATPTRECSRWSTLLATRLDIRCHGERARAISSSERALGCSFPLPRPEM